jgi:hypothetical protein
LAAITAATEVGRMIVFIINSMKSPAARWQAIADGAKEYFYVLFIQQRTIAQYRT